MIDILNKLKNFEKLPKVRVNFSKSFYQKVKTDRRFATLSNIQDLAKYFFSEKNFIIPENSINKLFLYIEFLIYNFPLEKGINYSEGFKQDSKDLFLDLNQNNLEMFFKKHKSESPLPKSHKIFNILDKQDVEKLIKFLTDFIILHNATNKQNILTEQKVLIEIFVRIPISIINYSLVKIINNFLKITLEKNTNPYIHETTFSEKIGMELFSIYTQKKIPSDWDEDEKGMDEHKSLFLKEFLKTLCEGNLSKEQMKIMNEKLEQDFGTLNLPSIGLMCFLNIIYNRNIKKPDQTEEFENLANQETKEFLLKVGYLLVSYLKTIRINNNFLLIEKKVKAKKIGVENYLELNSYFFEPILASNLPSFNENLLSLDNWGSEIRFSLDLKDFGYIEKHYQTVSDNSKKITIKGIDETNKENLVFLSEQKYFLNKAYGVNLISEMMALTPENINLFFDIDLEKLEKIKNNLYAVDFCLLEKLLFIPDFKVKIGKKTISDFSEKIKYPKNFNKIPPNSYEKTRKKLFLKITGQKVLLNCIIKEYLLLDSFSTITSKQDKPRNIWLYFVPLIDSRNRIYIGSNLLSPMSTSKYSNFISLDTQKIPCYFEKSKQIFDTVKDWNNFFIRDLVNIVESESLLESKELFYRFNNFRYFEENNENINFLQRFGKEAFEPIFNFKNFLTFRKSLNIPINKDIFNDFNNFLEIRSFLLEEEKNCKLKGVMKKLDASSSGIQISGLLLNSEDLLIFSNILNTNKSAGYNLILTTIRAFLFPLTELFERNKDEFFEEVCSYKFLDNVFSIYEITFLVFCRSKNKILFDDLINISLIKEVCIGKIYGMGNLGIFKLLNEFLSNNFSLPFYQEITDLFNVNIYYEKKIIDYPNFKELYQTFIEQRENTKNKVEKMILNQKIIMCEKSKVKIDLKFVSVVGKLLYYSVRKSAIKDNFKRMKPIFSSMCLIKEKQKNNIPFYIQNENFSFNINYFQEISTRAKIKTFKFKKNGDLDFIDNKKKISLKRQTKNLDIKRLSFAMISSVVQSFDAEILNNFIHFCKSFNIPLFCKHDQFGLPYQLNIFLRPLVAESILQIDWTIKLIKIVIENGILESNERIQTIEDFSVLVLQIKIRKLIYPALFDTLYTEITSLKRKFKKAKLVDQKILLDCQIFEKIKFLDEFYHIPLDLRIFYGFSPNFREIFTNEYFIK